MIIYNFFKYLFLNIKYSKILNNVYDNEHILENLSKMFNVNFKKDWIGRVYAVINPNISGDEFTTETQVFEYGVNGLNNDAYIERWVMQKLNIAQSFIQTNNLFDLLTYNIKRLDEYDNFLFIIQPITLDECLKYAKYFSILITILIVIGLTFLFII